MHGEVLLSLTNDDALVKSLSRDYRGAQLDPKYRTVLGYVAKLTRTSQHMEERDVEALRQAGYDDACISDINLICSYFNMLNRISQGLGIELGD